MEAYAGEARRRVHLVTVLLWPSSGYRLGGRQARHADILQIGLGVAMASVAQAGGKPARSIPQAST